MTYHRFTMRDLRKHGRGLRTLSREGCETSYVCNLSDMRESVKNSNCRMSQHARFMVAPSGFRILPIDLDF